MALLYICEYERPHEGGGFPMQVADETNGSLDQTPVVIGAGSLQSAAFAATTKFVRIETDAAVCIKFGPNPTAVANVSKRLAAGQTEYYIVRPGDKVAAIAPAI